jgi:hypothetical protein
MAPPPGEPPTLAALRAQRAELRSRIAGVQAEIDDLPVQPLDHPEASAAWEVRLAELTTERDALVATSRQLDQAIRALEETDQARATKAAGSNLEASLKSLVARLQVVEDEADRLPCALARAAATAAAGNQSSTARAWVQGARACDEAGARGAGCRFQTAPWCSAARADELYEAVAKNIGNACPPAPAGSFAGRIAAKHRRLLTAHFRRGQDRQPLDPKGFDSFAVAEGFYARRQATVTTRAGDVALTGLETALVFYGPTGTGKTLAACYLLARWGGVYMTAYDLAGVGQDPTCPSPHPAPGRPRAGGRPARPPAARGLGLRLGGAGEADRPAVCRGAGDGAGRQLRLASRPRGGPGRGVRQPPGRDRPGGAVPGRGRPPRPQGIARRGAPLVEWHRVGDGAFDLRGARRRQAARVYTAQSLGGGGTPKAASGVCTWRGCSVTRPSRGSTRP